MEEESCFASSVQLSQPKLISEQFTYSTFFRIFRHFRYRLLPSQTELREALSQAGQERRTVSLIVRFEMVVVVDYYCETRRGQGSDDVGDFILRYS